MDRDDIVAALTALGRRLHEQGVTGVLAHRVGEDEDDVRLLASRLELTTADEVLAVADERVGDRLDAAARFFVGELFAGG